jgi:hypothetical protein
MLLQVLLLYMSHPASTVRQQVSQLWEKVVQKRSSSGTALQHNVMRSLMSVVARYSSLNASDGVSTASSRVGKIDSDWAGMEAALLSLELVLRMLVSPASSSSLAAGSSSASAEVVPHILHSKASAGSSPPGAAPPGLASNSATRTGGSTSSGTSSCGNPSVTSLQTPSHAAAASHHMATPASPSERSPKPSPMHGQKPHHCH